MYMHKRKRNWYTQIIRTIVTDLVYEKKKQVLVINIFQKL